MIKLIVKVRKQSLKKCKNTVKDNVFYDKILLYIPKVILIKPIRYNYDIPLAGYFNIKKI